MEDWVDRSELIEYLSSSEGKLYRFLDKNDEIVYVGKTTRPIELRLAGHHSKNKIWEHIVKLETKAVSLDELDMAEAVEIHKYHPKFNKICPLSSCNFYSKPVYSPRYIPSEEELDRLLVGINAR